MSESPGINFAYLANLAFVFVLCAFWSAVQVLRTGIEFLRHGRSIFAVKPRPKPPAELTSAEWRHSRVALPSGLSLHVVESGDPPKDAPLMLFVHGFPEFWYTWRSQLRAFRDSFRVVAVDMRGYGDSDKPGGRGNYEMEPLVTDLAQLIPALGHEKAVVVAHDWGGAVAWQLAIHFPHLVHRFVVCNCPHPTAFRRALKGGSVKQLLKSWYMFFFQAPILPEIFLRLKDMTALDTFFRDPTKGGCRNPQGFTDADMEAWKYTFLQPGAITPPLNYYRAALTRHPEKAVFGKKGTRAAKVTAPTLIVWGTADVAIEQSTATMSADYCEDCTIRFVEGASHWIQNDEPDLTNQFIRAFLASH